MNPFTHALEQAEATGRTTIQDAEASSSLAQIQPPTEAEIQHVSELIEKQKYRETVKGRNIP